MKISELIHDLEEIISKHGDLLVCWYDHIGGTKMYTPYTPRITTWMPKHELINIIPNHEEEDVWEKTKVEDPDWDMDVWGRAQTKRPPTRKPTPYCVDEAS